MTCSVPDECVRSLADTGLDGCVIAALMTALRACIWKPTLSSTKWVNLDRGTLKVWTRLGRRHCKSVAAYNNQSIHSARRSHVKL